LLFPADGSADGPAVGVDPEGEAACPQAYPGRNASVVADKTPSKAERKYPERGTRAGIGSTTMRQQVSLLSDDGGEENTFSSRTFP